MKTIFKIFLFLILCNVGYAQVDTVRQDYRAVVSITSSSYLSLDTFQIVFNNWADPTAVYDASNILTDIVQGDRLLALPSITGQPCNKYIIDTLWSSGVGEYTMKARNVDYSSSAGNAGTGDGAFIYGNNENDLAYIPASQPTLSGYVHPDIQTCAFTHNFETISDGLIQSGDTLGLFGAGWKPNTYHSADYWLRDQAVYVVGDSTSIRFTRSGNDVIAHLGPSGLDNSQEYNLYLDGSGNRTWVKDSLFIGDTGSGGSAGKVPAPTSGDASAGKFLHANGTWALPPTDLLVVENITDIASLSPDTSNLIYVRSLDQTFYVSNTALAGYTTDEKVVVTTANSKFAIIRPRNNVLYVEWFGANASDTTHDFDEFQNGITFAKVTGAKELTSEFSGGRFYKVDSTSVDRLNLDDMQDFTLSIQDTIYVTPTFGQQHNTIYINSNSDNILLKDLKIVSDTLYDSFVANTNPSPIPDNYTSNVVGIRIGNLSSVGDVTIENCYFKHLYQMSDIGAANVFLMKGNYIDQCLFGSNSGANVRNIAISNSFIGEQRGLPVGQLHGIYWASSPASIIEGNYFENWDTPVKLDGAVNGEHSLKNNVYEITSSNYVTGSSNQVLINNGNNFTSVGDTWKGGNGGLTVSAKNSSISDFTVEVDTANIESLDFLTIQLNGGKRIDNFTMRSGKIIGSADIKIRNSHNFTITGMSFVNSGNKSDNGGTLFKTELSAPDSSCTQINISNTDIRIDSSSNYFTVLDTRNGVFNIENLIFYDSLQRAANFITMRDGTKRIVAENVTLSPNIVLNNTSPYTGNDNPAIFNNVFYTDNSLPDGINSIHNTLDSLIKYPSGQLRNMTDSVGVKTLGLTASNNIIDVPFIPIFSSDANGYTTTYDIGVGGAASEVGYSLVTSGLTKFGADGIYPIFYNPSNASWVLDGAEIMRRISGTMRWGITTAITKQSWGISNVENMNLRATGLRLGDANAPSHTLDVAGSVQIDDELIIDTASVEPSTPLIGTIYVDDGTNTQNGDARPRMYDGDEWIDLGVSSLDTVVIIRDVSDALLPGSTGLITGGWYRVPASLGGYHVAKIEYTVLAAGAGINTYGVRIDKNGGASTFGAASFSTSDVSKTATSGAVLVEDDIIRVDVTDVSMTTDPTGLQVTLTFVR